MKLRALAICIGAVAILAIACSGSDGDDSERVLELRGYDITEADYRTSIQSRFLNPLNASICDSLVGLSAPDVVALADIEDDDPQETPPPRATVKPDQLGDPDDRERAAEIILEECDRLSE